MRLSFQQSVISVASLVICASSGAETHSTNHNIRAFSPHHVRLNSSSFAAKTMALNQEYLLSLDVDSLLLTFRKNADLLAPGNPFVGSWEDPACEVRGQFMGHYLSATARLQGIESIAARTTFIVTELKKVQDKLGSGYLSAFPTEHFDRLQNLQPVWAPYYVIHKIMAGLLDQYLFADSSLALHMVTDMASYFGKCVDATLKVNGTNHWHEMLNNEFGGMSEVLHNLYGITKNREHLRLAGLFVKPSFYEPLVALQDPLAGLHANTHLAQVNGFAAQYEKTGDKDALTAVQHFFDVITHHHSYATGGSNDGEFWGPADRIADAISEQQHALETEETCTQYNMLKIAGYLFRWTGNVTYADYYERAIMNGLLGTQRMPASDQTSVGQQKHHQLASSHDSGVDDASEKELGQLPARGTAGESSRPHVQGAANNLQGSASSGVHVHTANWRQAAFAQFKGLGLQQAQGGSETAAGPGVLLYLLPMGVGQSKGQSSHGWGTPLHSFWCCYGSSVESFAKLPDSIYFYRTYQDVEPGGPVVELYINQLVSSTLKWHSQGLTIDQSAALYGPNNTAVTKLVFTSDNNSSDMIAVKLRIPSWVAEGTSEVRLNGQIWRECHEHLPAESLLTQHHGTALSSGRYCNLKGVFKTGDVITAKFPMVVRAETVQDNRPQFQSLAAVMIGPMLMAGLTENTRSILANASNLTPLVSELSVEGLVSLSLPGSADVYMQQQDKCLVAGYVQPGNAAAMAATFRMLDISRSPLQRVKVVAGRQQIVLESMHLPGHIVMHDSQHNLVLHNLHGLPLDHALPAGFDLPTIHVTATNASGPTLEIASPHLDSSYGQVPSVPLKSHVLDSEWVVELPKGRYPDGSKLLKGSDRSYVISPMGNIVDEKYTAYFEFHSSV